MDSLLSSLGYINFLVLIFILVFVHELGHYLIARACGVRVEVFSIGFGKELIGYTDRFGTRWRLSLLPLGGYVKMKGEMVLSREAAASFSGDSDSFHCRSLWRRILVVLGGPLANYVYAALVLALLFVFAGRPVVSDYSESGIGSVVAGSAADLQGLRRGDIITWVNDRRIDSFEDLSVAVRDLSGHEALRLQVLRGARSFSVSLRPQRIDGGYRLGVTPPAVRYEKLGVGESLWLGVRNCYDFTVLILDSVGGMLSGRVSTDDLGGPIRIAQLSKDFGASGAYAFFYLTVVLSINLGLLNLFPIPMLDGGHLLFYLYEAVMGRPVGLALQNFLLRLGLFFLVFLFLWITFNDIVRLIF